MKKLAILLSLSAAAFGAQAQCFGSGSFQTCTDASGNSYTVNRMGNTTMVNGSGPNGTWNQTSQTIGNTTFHNGQAVNGNNWHGSTQSIGNMQIHQGVDSRGSSYQKTCTPYGCY
jgi:hypothetical protein